MARGMVVGERIVSQAQTREFDEGYARTFGDKPRQRGRWVWDRAQGRLVPADEYVPPSSDARCAPIMTGACHEGQVAPDGTDISSRRKRAAWSKASGCADYDDFKSARAARQKMLAERAELVRTGKPSKPDKELRQIIGRELYRQKVIL